MITHDDIRRIALSLPGAYEQASYGGRPSFRTKPRGFCWIRDDPEALVVPVESLEEKEAMLASEPEKFFTTPHYDGYATVLVNLRTVDVEEATELIADAWRMKAPSKLVKEWNATHP